MFWKMRIVDMEKALQIVYDAEKYIYSLDNLTQFQVQASNELIGTVKRVVYKLLEICEVKEG